MDLGWDEGARVAVPGLGFLPPPVTHLLRNMTEVASNFAGWSLSPDSSRVVIEISQKFSQYLEKGLLIVESTTEYLKTS